MKKLYSILTLALVALFINSCSKDRINFGGEDKPTIEEYGYLSFAEGGLSVITDTEVVRSGAVDVNTFICTIVDDLSGETVVDDFTYGSRPTEPISLKVGSYVLKVVSGDIPGAEWESPVYGAEQEFSIKPKQTTTISDVKCKLMNVKVTIGYDVDLMNLLEAGSYTDVTLGSNSLKFDYTEARAGYLLAPAAENIMTISMNLNYMGKSTSMSAEIAGVKPGQWRNITVNMPHANEGNVIFQIVIETLTVDQEVVVDVAELVAMTEEVIPDDPIKDPLAPSYTFAGGDLAEPYYLASYIDEGGNYTGDATFTITANEGATIASLPVIISSTSSSLLAEFAAMGIDTEFDLTTITSNTSLRLLGFKFGSNVLGQSSVVFDFANLMTLLADFDGTHNFTFEALDSENRYSTTTLTVVVGEGGVSDPSIVWVDHDIKQAYAVTDDLKVVINVTSSKGIAQLYVDIISDLLTKEELESANLTDHLDLVTPGEYEGSLNGLGFPTGDDVLGKNELTFDISPFMSMLLLVAGGETCYTNFQLTVIDAEGNQTVETIQLLMN